MKLYMAIQRRLFGFVISLVPDSAAVDDIVQETVAYMWKRFDEYEPGTDFAAWAFAVARNRVFEHIKHKKREERTFSIETLEAIDRLAEKKAERADGRLDALHQCVAALNSRDRELLNLRYEVGATLKTVSERIELSVNTLYSRLYKIRIALVQCVRNKMAREGC